MDVAAQQDGSPVERDLDLPSGRMRVRLHGPEGGRLVVGVPGLSANRMSFEAMARHLASSGRRFAAVDLRGRGRSPAGFPGTHGWDAHARDVVAVAEALGARTFDQVGHSMGAFVGLALANLFPDRLRRLVLVDAVGVPDARAMPPIFAAAQRLGSVYPSVDAFLEKVKAAATVPWNAHWEAHYREDLEPCPGGVKQRANPAAVMEDMLHAGGRDVRALWPGVGTQALLIRAALPLAEGGFVITPEDRDGFVARAPRARFVEIQANHYGVIDHPETARAVEEFIG